MGTKTTDAKLLQKGFLSAAKNLEANKDWINELNVFPVPDGDTGTNMTLTMIAARDAICELNDPTVKELCKAISSGSLRGARGNSGVILSQLLRGFTRELKGAKVIDLTAVANAMVRGTETAYKAVMKPKEGTILTVAKCMSERAVELASETDDVAEFCRGIVEAGDDALMRTTEMLPELKAAGVIDSGGQGLMEVVKGAIEGIFSDSDDIDFVPEHESKDVKRKESGNAGEEEEIRFGYCTEFLITPDTPFDEEQEAAFRAFLTDIGDCIVVIADDDIVKVHVHTNDPGVAIQKGLSYGPLSKIKIDNMREQHHERLIKHADKVAAQQQTEIENARAAREEAKRLAEEKAAAAEPPKPFGFLTVVSGEGLKAIFKEIGADEIIDGGQTMNPSTDDILNAADSVNADVVFVLPNNPNIVMAAEQAAGLSGNHKVYVIPSHTIPQGIEAMLHFSPDLSVEENVKIMSDEMLGVKSAEVTYAVRDTVIDGEQIREGDYMGLNGNSMYASGSDLSDVTTDTVKSMIDDDTELITLYYGADISEDEALTVSERIHAACPDFEVELHYGGQPVYYYILSAE